MICKHCNEAELIIVEEDEPWHPAFWQCPICDSTYNIKDEDE
jgi:hypothetical protein